MNKIIRSIAWLVFFLFFIGFSVSIYIDSRELEPREHQSKQVELKQNYISGYKDGNVSWQVSADYIWSGRSRYLYQAQEIQSGLIMNREGRIIIDHIQAQMVKVNTRSKTFRTTGGLQAVFNRKMTDQDGKSQIKPIFIKATYLNYYQLSNRTVIQEHIELKQDDVIIRPQGMVVVDHDLDQVTISDRVLIHSDEFEVTANEMVMFLNEDYSQLNGGVEGRRFAKVVTDEKLDSREIELRAKDTFFSAKSLYYKNIKGKDEIHLIGDVMINQARKTIKGDKAFYAMEDDLYFIEGKVVLSSESLSWVIDKHKKEQFKNEVARESIEKKVTISAEKMTFDAKTHYFKMFGDVEILQDDKVIRAKKLEFNDETGTLVLFGDVSINYEDGDKIETEYIEVNIDHETVFAGKGVETEFEVELNKNEK